MMKSESSPPPPPPPPQPAERKVFEIGVTPRPLPETSCPPDNPDWWKGLNAAAKCSELMLQIYLAELYPEQVSSTLDIFEDIIDDLPDLIQAARVCAEAYRNRGAYQSTGRFPNELAVNSRMAVVFIDEDIETLPVEESYPYSELSPRVESSPCVGMSNTGHVLFWSLPGAISIRLQRIAEEALKKLKESDRNAISLLDNCPSLFRNPTPTFGRGVAHIDYWLDIDVRHNLTLHYIDRLNIVLQNPFSLIPLYHNYLRDMAPVLRVLAGISALTVPNQSTDGWRLQRGLMWTEGVEWRLQRSQFIQHWLLPFEVLSIQVNMGERCDRDEVELPQAYNLHADFGQYSDGEVIFPTLNTRRTANPGTVTICPRSLVHGTPHANGEHFRLIAEPQECIRMYHGYPRAHDRYLHFTMLENLRSARRVFDSYLEDDDCATIFDGLGSRVKTQKPIARYRVCM
ncbi:hypothetical protein NMY22_g2996 [Coprinellus aureogranulatus]|nr:hypothetical protein NMY22_g2996 [Coprinellus aureogranulatus]